jgi:hypothetical protein
MKEVDAIGEYAAYQTHYEKPRAKYAAAWSGVCLNSKDGDPYSEMTEDLPGSPHTPRVRTEIGKLCPYMWTIAEDIGATAYRVRVMRIAPKSSLDWHSHVIWHHQPEATMTIHLPIIVPEKFSYQVMPAAEWDEWSKTGRTPVIYSKRYEPGRLAMFNSYHYHNVFNDSGEYRISLMMYARITNAKTAAIFKKAAAAYDGPLI